MRLWILSLVCWVSSAFAGTTDDAIPDARYLEHGQKFAAHTARLDVVRVEGVQAAGSCVLISDRVALTAAHVLDRFRSGVVVAASGRRKVVRTQRHPEFREEVFGLHDIAVVVVDEPFGLEKYPELADGSEKAGDTVHLAGFGLTGRLSTGYDKADGLLRAGTAKISRLESTLLVCPARSAGTELPMCTAPGDSGGPVFLAGKVAGIASHTMKDADGTPSKSKDGEESCHTRVSLYREWIAAASR
jgi:hypothetical protein